MIHVVDLLPDDSLIVEECGGEISVDPDAVHGIVPVEVTLTTLRSGGRLDDHSCQLSVRPSVAAPSVARYRPSVHSAIRDCCSGKPEDVIRPEASVASANEIVEKVGGAKPQSKKHAENANDTSILEQFVRRNNVAFNVVRVPAVASVSPSIILQSQRML